MRMPCPARETARVHGLAASARASTTLCSNISTSMICREVAGQLHLLSIRLDTVRPLWFPRRYTISGNDETQARSLRGIVAFAACRAGSTGPQQRGDEKTAGQS